MPTYQYTCTACGHQLEAVQSFTDAPLTECPECSGRLRKRFSSVGIVFKGSGFYRTDSRSESRKGSSTVAASNGGMSTESSSSPAGTNGATSGAANGSGKSGEKSTSNGSGSGSAPSQAGSKPATAAV